MTSTSHKVALITGASRGIGKQLAIDLARMGYKTALIGRNKDALVQTAQDIKELNNQESFIYTIDITDSQQIHKMVDQVVSEYGRVDILVNNAGIHALGTLELPEQDFRRLLEVNITGQFLITQAIVPVMKNQGSGYIFNVASRSAKVGFAGTGGYCSSKWGLLGLSESLYRELTPIGIKVTALCPAWVDTDMADRAGSPLKPDQRIRPEDLSGTVKWLLSLSSGACVKEVVITNPMSL